MKSFKKILLIILLSISFFTIGKFIFEIDLNLGGPISSNIYVREKVINYLDEKYNCYMPNKVFKFKPINIVNGPLTFPGVLQTPNYTLDVLAEGMDDKNKDKKISFRVDYDIPDNKFDDSFLEEIILKELPYFSKEERNLSFDQNGSSAGVEWFDKNISIEDFVKESLDIYRVLDSYSIFLSGLSIECDKNRYSNQTFDLTEWSYFKLYLNDKLAKQDSTFLVNLVKVSYPNF